jgi:hypothetical protein
VEIEVGVSGPEAKAGGEGKAEGRIGSRRRLKRLKAEG